MTLAIFVLEQRGEQAVGDKRVYVFQVIGVVVYLGKVDILHIRSASNVHLAIAKD